MKTFSAKPLELQRNWWLIDADGQTLGRLASTIASILRGKHRADFTPHIDTGDFVVVVNAEKIHVTGKKAQQKKYYRNTGYPGGLRITTYEEMLEKHPDRILEYAVKGMLPKNTLGHNQLLKLKIYAGPEHPHAAQQPKPYPLKSLEVANA
jgi:large subunit ribosomal protein L13